MYINAKLTLRRHFKIIKKVFKVDKILSYLKKTNILIVLLVLFSACEILSSKKRKKFKTGLITSIYILLQFVLLQIIINNIFI